ncbi:MAG: hypothetical protein ACI9TH_004716 [Kiritimatiellia bacterium]|jgi:hypothetical protein
MKIRPLLSALGLAMICPFARADLVFTQGAADTHIAFEAETYDSLVYNAPGQGFVHVDTASSFVSAFGSEVLAAGSNASGGEALMDDLRVVNGDHSSTVTYKMSFQQAGTYRMYVRYSMFEDNGVPTNYGNEDSFYRPIDFGETATEIVTGYNTVNSEGVFGWHNTNADYTVGAGQLNQIQVFNIDDRESGLTLDRIAFSSINSLDGAALDLLANSAAIPEPSTLGLMLIGAFALMRRAIRRTPAC